MMIIWIDDWQMQCCGDPFNVYDAITWTVVAWDTEVPNFITQGHIDYYYENHTDDFIEITATVEKIQCIYQVFQYDPKVKANVPLYGKLEDYDGELAYGIEQNQEEYQFTGYLVTLKK